jgi:hypothetical protein
MFGVPNSRFVAFLTAATANASISTRLTASLTRCLVCGHGSAETTTAIVGILSASPNTVGEMPHHFCDVDFAHVGHNPARVNRPSDQTSRADSGLSVHDTSF